MIYVLIRHKVQDFASWKKIFDQHSATRKKFGSLGGKLFQTIDDPNEVVLLLKGNDLQRVRDFMASVHLKKTMGEAGVLGMPEVAFLREPEEFSN